MIVLTLIIKKATIGPHHRKAIATNYGRTVNARACTGGREFESQSRSNLTQRCKRFATASTTTQAAVLPWRYDAKMGTANSLHVSA